MIFQIGPAREIFATGVAAEDFAGVALKVQIQRWLPLEAFATDMADEWFFNRVHPVVVGEVGLGPESFVANVARVGPFVRVAPHVRLKVALVGKGL